MDILYLMIICSVSLGVIFLIIFIVSAKKGQFEDDESPAVRILLEKDFDEKEVSNAEDQEKSKE